MKAFLPAIALAGALVASASLAAAAIPPLSIGASGSPAATFHPAAFSTGDVIAGIGNGRWNHFDASGTLLSTLDDGQVLPSSGFEPLHATAGVCFDPAGNMFGMNLDNNSMSKFSNDGTLLAATVGTFSANPEACLVIDGNTMFTSQVRGTGGILKLDLAGNQLAKYGSMRTDWIDLAADRCSMYYSDEGSAIHRYDVCTNKPLPDFVANLGVRIYALRILPNQTVLAATGAGVQLFDASGKQLSLYPLTGQPVTDRILTDPFALNLDPDGISFWTARLGGKTIFKFAIAPVGPPILTFDAQVAAGGGSGVAGLGVFGERVAAQVAGPVSTTSDIGPLLLVGLLVFLVLILLLVALMIRSRRRGDARPE